MVALQVDKTQLMDVLKEEPSFKHGSHFEAAKAALTDKLAGETGSKLAAQPGGTLFNPETQMLLSLVCLSVFTIYLVHNQARV